MQKQVEIGSVRAEFIEKIGVSAQNEGLPRIAGRVLGTLIFDGKPASFSDLAESLLVSRGSISNSVRLLEERLLIKRVAKAGDRQDYFQLADNPYTSMLDGVVNRIARVKLEIDESLAQIPDDAGGPRARLAQYAGFYGAMVTGLEDALNNLRQDKS
ncbi:hypothetical protein GCM10008927_25020 [Amylibacter ulvae]|uniref:HTH marR-type domain-containing protein n=1 Tax=Paramylibacter ulvae TaxID=1651968 RepID=A0ABQ3D4G2_9RHOB|nr:MarR family transcriptional regulator [Amylibacter ulvae]GHA58397.1 hypothetical protein GCM10008927_25020 [Amylibacter ulvae]